MYFMSLLIEIKYEKTSCFHCEENNELIAIINLAETVLNSDSFWISTLQ